MSTLELILSLACVALAILAVAAALKANAHYTDFLAALAGKNEYWGKLRQAENELAESGALVKSLAESSRRNAADARQWKSEFEERQKDLRALEVERRQLTQQCADFSERIRQLEQAGGALAALVSADVEERFTTSGGNPIPCRETAALAAWENLFPETEGRAAR